MSPHRRLIFQAVLDAARRRPVRDRVRLYRAAADFAGSPDEAAPFLTLAAELEAIEQCHAALAQKFQITAAAPHVVTTAAAAATADPDSGTH